MFRRGVAAGVGYGIGKRGFDVAVVFVYASDFGGMASSHGHASQFNLCLHLVIWVKLSPSGCLLGDRFTQIAKSFGDNLPITLDSEQIYL